MGSGSVPSSFRGPGQNVKLVYREPATRTSPFTVPPTQSPAAKMGEVPSNRGTR